MGKIQTNHAYSTEYEYSKSWLTEDKKVNSFII